MEPEEHVFDLLPAYALGSLEKDEKIMVSNHLAVCEICRAELTSYEKIVDDLPLAMIESAPPTGLKDKILGQVARSAPQDTVQDRMKPADNRTRSSSWWQRLQHTLPKLTPAWGLASLTIIVILSISNLVMWQRLDNLESAQQSNFSTVTLTGTNVIPGASGVLVISDDGKHGTLVVDDLPGLDQAHQYQLWLILDGKRTSGGVFSVDADGYGSLWVSSPLPLMSYSAFGVTIEPAGGSSGPTGDKVLGGQL